MAVRFKPITKFDDYLVTGSNDFVTNRLSNEASASRPIRYKEKYKKSNVGANERKIYPLTMEMCNPSMCKADGKFVNRIIGLKSDHIKDIIMAEKSLGDIDPKDMPYDIPKKAKNYVGAEAIRFLLEEIVNNIDYYIERRIKSLFSKTELEGMDFNTEGRGTCIYEGYYYSVEVGNVSKKIKESYRRNFGSIDALYALKRNPSLIEAFFMTNVIMVPVGMRPSVEGRIDPLTKLTLAIVNRDQDLSAAKHNDPNKTQDSVNNCIRKLQQAINDYIATKSAGNNKQQKSILEKLNGKTGQIRMYNLGKRQDYSARSVVTVDPFLSLNRIRIPEWIIPKLYESYVIRDMDPESIKDITSPDKKDKCLEFIKEKRYVETIPVLMGRQPTLHKQSIQGFMPLIGKGKAISVNPLVCPAYNMDFDGDTSWEAVPITPAAAKELSQLAITTLNLRLGNNGECTICPRQDMLYGLFFCTRSKYTIGSPRRFYNNLDELYEGVVNCEIEVHETALVGTENMIAGYGAFKACFPNPDDIEIKEITSKSIKSYIEEYVDGPQQQFIDMIDKLVKLGFKTARRNVKSVSILRDMPAIPQFDNAIDNFHKEIDEAMYLYSIGLEESTDYSIFFGEKFEEAENAMSDTIYDKVTENSAFWHMAKSGARGNASNLLQMFAYKGRIQKSASESFNVIIEECHAEGIKPMGHFISSYGARKGQIDKSLKTGDTGYASRKIWHADEQWIINNEDCGTTDGIEIRKDEIVKYILTPDTASEVDDMFVKLISGKFVAGTNEYIDKSNIDKFKHLDKIKIRSPLKCKDPCCVKCYGRNYYKNEPAHRGLAVGIIAAQSIGEKLTQTTLKQFQKGGVAGTGDVASAFERLMMYAELNKKITDTFLYDPIAWASGKVLVANASSTKDLIRIEGSRKTVKVPKGMPVKEYVEQGESIFSVRGDHYVREIEDYDSFEHAQMYLLYKLISIMKSEADIAPVHFEVLVASMVKHKIYRSNNPKLPVGITFNTPNLYKHLKNNSDVDYYTTFEAIGSCPFASGNPLAYITFERIAEGLFQAVMSGIEDDLDAPLQAIALGLKPKVGTYYEDFIG